LFAFSASGFGPVLNEVYDTSLAPNSTPVQLAVHSDSVLLSPRISFPTFSPDGAWVGYLYSFQTGQTASGVYLVPADAHAATRGVNPEDYAMGLEFTADSQRVVFRASYEGLPDQDLFSATMTGSSQVLASPGANSVSRIGPDGATVFYCG